MGQRRLSINWDQLLDVCKATGRLYGVSSRPLPSDARIVRLVLRPETTRLFDLVLESSEWPPVSDAGHIPCCDEPHVFSVQPHPARGPV